MATVVLSYAGAALGTFLGGPIGGIIGRAVGGLAGSFLDQQLLGSTRRIEGPRLTDLRIMASEEGAAIPVLWGHMRVAGQVIWSTNLEEVAATNTSKASGKGGGAKTRTTSYSYFGNFAVGLCEGEIDGIGRVWADGKLLDITQFTTRLYTGGETQAPDSLIEAIEGAGQAPAYRGLAYVVFEKLPLEKFGNRLPQLSFEVLRSANSAADALRAVTLIPGSTEFGYDTAVVTRTLGNGRSAQENAHLSNDLSDWTVSANQLQATCRNLTAAALVVAWFGDDLRCGSCSVRPRVDSASKVTSGATWSVTGLSRAAATVVSSFAGKPAYGGTPSDLSVVRAITDLKNRGLAVVFNPFLLMDVPEGNSLPNPYGGTGQPAYPWRGRITASLAPGQSGTPDKTAALQAEIDAFLGAAGPDDFTVSGTSVVYAGPVDWGYRRMILHYANLCAAAGGVDAFLIGSELRGLTTLRSAASTYPFVAALMQLASEVKAILPAAQVSYAADWSEYFGHQPADGTGDVHFHLDPLWASDDVGFIGIDNYMPLTDWRDGETHLDAALSPSIYDLGYLKSRMAGGEGYDWYYASATDRQNQVRTAISDGAYGKPWVFRFKDLKNWWTNPHHDRPGGIENGAATAWVPQSKPFWFTETGCPAIDKGANQPNVFVDVKSAESALPHFSGGQRDDLMQNRFLLAQQQYWSAVGANNPVSSVYGETMVDAARIFHWCWDARPYPLFPARADVWSDAVNVARGHWLNGRLGAVDAARLITDICARHGLTDIDVSGAAFLVEGFGLDRPMSGREALEALLNTYATDLVESQGVLKFAARRKLAGSILGEGDFVDGKPEVPLRSATRLQEADLPRAVMLAYLDPAIDYRGTAVSRQRAQTASEREIMLSLPAAVAQEEAQARVDILLEEAWAQRTRHVFQMPPSTLALEPGDVVTAGADLLRLTTVLDGAARKIEALQCDAHLYEPPPSPPRASAAQPAQLVARPYALLMDLAMVAADPPAAPWIAAQATPWPGTLALLRQNGAASFVLNRLVSTAATMGITLTALPQGLPHRLDHTATLDVTLDFGALASVSREELLNGANVAAIGTMATGFEIIQFETATLIAANTYRLSGLLRAQGASAAEMQVSRAAGQDFVLLNDAVVPSLVTLAEASLPSTWRVGPAFLDSAHPSYLQLSMDSTLRALRPLSPVHARMKRVPGGVELRWIRQTRVSGDSWDLAEVPLGEDSESYLLEILDDATVKRTETLSSPAYFYADAAMTADFGAPQTTLRLRVAQLSAVIGPGTSLERLLHV
jgi:hypothetical protein